MLNPNITGLELLEYLKQAYPNEKKQVIMETVGLTWSQIRGAVDRFRLSGHRIPDRPHNIDLPAARTTPGYVQYLIDNYETATREDIRRACGGVSWGTVTDRVRRLRRQGHPIPVRTPLRDCSETGKGDPERVLEKLSFEKLTTLPRRCLVDAIMLYRERKK